MPTSKQEPDFEKLKAKTLSSLVRQSDLNAAEALAFLAYASHGDTTPLMDAREEGADIGSIGKGAHALRTRIKDQLA